MTNEKTHEMNNLFNSVNVLFFLWRWRKILMIIGIATVIVSSAFSLMITPKFESKVIMFPTSTNSISKALISESYGAKKDIMEFGEEEQAEQLLQVLHSSLIRDRIVEKFNLFDHYDIKSGSKYRQTNLIQEYRSNIKFNRTKYMAVEISVMDKNPQMAADIANEIASLLDSVMNDMQKERAVQAFKIVENTFLKLNSDINRMEDSLAWLRSKGVFDYESQSERIFETLSREVASGNSRGINALQQQLDTLAKYGGAYVSLRDALEHEKKQLVTIKLKFEEAKIDAEEFLPHKFIVDRAFKAEKKSYPVRWLIVVVSTISTFFLTLIGIIILENIRNYNSTNRP
jgi:capsular polysaccharide biosynthesis protein